MTYVLTVINRLLPAVQCSLRVEFWVPDPNVPGTDPDAGSFFFLLFISRITSFDTLDSF